MESRWDSPWSDILVGFFILRFAFMILRFYLTVQFGEWADLLTQRQGEILPSKRQIYFANLHLTFERSRSTHAI